MLHPCPRPPCPDCGADDALAFHASYRHRPPRALRWLAPFFPLHLTRAYACAACHQRVLINTSRPHAPALAPRPRPPPPSPRTPRHATQGRVSASPPRDTAPSPLSGLRSAPRARRAGIPACGSAHLLWHTAS